VVGRGGVGNRHCGLLSFHHALQLPTAHHAHHTCLCNLHIPGYMLACATLHVLQFICLFSYAHTCTRTTAHASGHDASGAGGVGMTRGKTTSGGDKETDLIRRRLNFALQKNSCAALIVPHATARRALKFCLRTPTRIHLMPPLSEHCRVLLGRTSISSLPSIVKSC